MEDTGQVTFYEPQLLLEEVGECRFSTVLQHGAGTVERLPVTTPARDLIAAAEIDCRAYRREIKRLRDEHPLFAARLDIPAADFEDFVAEALLLPSMLQKADPVSFFVLGELLDRALLSPPFVCCSTHSTNFSLGTTSRLPIFNTWKIKRGPRKAARWLCGERSRSGVSKPCRLRRREEQRQIVITFVLG